MSPTIYGHCKPAAACVVCVDRLGICRNDSVLDSIMLCFITNSSIGQVNIQFVSQFVAQSMVFCIVIIKK